MPILCQLQTDLKSLISDARLKVYPLAGTPIRLWLIDDDNMQRAFSSAETATLMQAPPYWSFCWASGLALARWILAHPQRVQGRRVLDFGAGSGVVAIAAAMAGAAQVTVCDLDPRALQACRANAELNHVTLDYSADFFTLHAPIDLLFAADVLYDAANLPLLEHFRQRAAHCIIADSRVRELNHPHFAAFTQLEAITCPDLAEPLEYRTVNLFQTPVE